MRLVRMVEKSLMEGLPVLLHFPQSSINEWVCSEGLLPTKEGDILKQSEAFLSIRWLSARSCSDSGSLTMETAIFVKKSHLKKWQFSLPRGAKISVNPLNLVILDFTRGVLWATFGLRDFSNYQCTSKKKTTSFESYVRNEAAWAESEKSYVWLLVRLQKIAYSYYVRVSA